MVATERELARRHFDPLMAAVQDYRKNLMRRLYAAGVSQAIIADAFEVTRQAVHAVVHDPVGGADGDE